MDLRRAERAPTEGEETNGLEEDKPEKTLHAALGLDAVLAAGSLHGLAVLDVEGDEEEASQDVSNQKPMRR